MSELNRRRPSHPTRSRRFVVLGVIASFFVAVDTPASRASEPEAVASPYVVLFHDPPGLSVGDRFAGEEVIRVGEMAPYVVVETRRPERLHDARRNNENVAVVEPDAPVYAATTMPMLHPRSDSAASDEEGVEAAGTPNDPRWGAQYGPNLIGGPLAWDIYKGAKRTSVCVVDTGIERTHEDLADARWNGWRDFVNQEDDPYDDNGHGTHVAGIAAARVDNGVGIAGMGNSAMYGAKVLDRNASGSTSRFAEGINWCTNRPAARVVINLSLGTTFDSTLVRTAVQDAEAAGRLLVGAAGNDTCGNCVLYPARYDEVIAVSCIDENSDHCAFSNRGPEIELAAPGMEILSTDSAASNAYAFMTGTSMAAPHVAGSLALTWSYHKDWTAAKIRKRARDTAKRLGSSPPNSEFGYGRVDAKCLLSRTPYPPRDLEASAGPGSGEVALTWKPASFTCKISTDGYNVYRETSSGWLRVGTVGPTTYAFTDSGLSKGTQYRYYVRTENRIGESAPSNKAKATTFAKPSEPLDPRAAPGVFPGTVVVSWSPPTSNGGTPITGYEVLRSEGDTSNYAIAASLSPSDRTWTDGGRTLGTTYYYRIRALNLAGAGAKSSVVCSKPGPSLEGLC